MVALGTDDKKKIYVLAGLAGVLGIVGVAVLVPRGGTTNDTNTLPPAGGTVPAPDSPPAGPAGVPPMSGAPGAPGAPGVAPPAGGTATLASMPGTSQPTVNVESFRSDPFQSTYTKVPPLPPPEPPPVVMPQPDSVELPSTDGPYGLPSPGGGMSANAEALVGLSPVRIPRIASIPSAPRSVPPAPQSSGPRVVNRSGNKRLAGVIIPSDSSPNLGAVRALLEIIDENGEPTTRIVQPGDEVDGIRILRIERYTEGGGRSRVRMIIRENNEERSVELRAAPQVNTMGAEGMPGGPGMPGMPGGFPGGPPGFPGGGRGFAPPPPR